MTAQPTGADLLRRIEAAWAPFEGCIRAIAPQLLDVAPAGAWSPKQHVVHVSAWERRALAALEDTPTFEALGIGPADFATFADTHAINAGIHARFFDITVEEALRGMERTHDALIAALRAATEGDLDRPFLPDWPAPARTLREGIPVDTCDHYPEHVEALQALLARDR